MARYILQTDTPSTVLKVNKIVFCLFFSEETAEDGVLKKSGNARTAATAAAGITRSSFTVKLVYL